MRPDETGPSVRLMRRDLARASPAAVGDARLARDLVVEVQLEPAVLDEVLQQGLDVAGVHLARVLRHRAGQLSRPTIVTLWRTTVSPGTVSSQFPPVSAARSTMTEPGRMPNTAASVMSTGARLPGIAAVVMTASASATCAGDQLLLALVLLLG